jgi:large subunit ribosomal protein L3
MSMRAGLLGKKLGMTQVFADDGDRIPVTVIQVGPNFVVGKRTPEQDGYSALVLGFEEKPLRLSNKPSLGTFKKANLKPMRLVREFRLPPDVVAQYEVGQSVKPSDMLPQGIPVDVTGISKGKGYQGVMKLHKMGGGASDSHGTHEFFRHGGSIGCRLTPGRVHKGKRMSSHMGSDRKTVQNLQLWQVRDDDNVVLVRGSVPGAINSYVTVKKAATRELYKEIGKGEVEVRSKNPLKASKKAAAGKA